MKVFFTASQRGKKFFDQSYRKIFETIKELGYQHIDDELVRVSTDSFYDKLNNEGLDSYKKLYEASIKAVKEADVNVFECSFPSLSIGYMVQSSIDNGKPTIVMYQDTNVPQFLAGIDDERLILAQYKPENVKDVLSKAFDESRHKMDKRFNFFISPDLLTYIDKASKKLKVTKSTLIRNLIVEHMRKSKSKYEDLE